MNLSDLKIRIKRQFGDESGVQVTDADIVRWANDAQRGIVTQNEGLLEKTSVSSSVTGTIEYPLPGDCLDLKSVSYRYSSDLPYYRMEGCAFSQFDRYVDGWDGGNFTVGYPAVYTVFADSLKIFPSPASDSTDGIKFYYTREPIDLVNDSDIIDLPVIYHNAVLNHCLGQAYEMDEDANMVQLKVAQVEKDVRSARARTGWVQQDTYQTITVMPEDQW